MAELREKTGISVENSLQNVQKVLLLHIFGKAILFINLARLFMIHFKLRFNCSSCQTIYHPSLTSDETFHLEVF